MRDRIRYAAPPTGTLRWQAPKVPAKDRSSIKAANAFSEACLQSPKAGPPFGPSVNGSEDCLFLNVYAPSNAHKLPVLIWMHGGGYGVGDGTENLVDLINTNDNGIIGVSIQYRVSFHF